MSSAAETSGSGPASVGELVRRRAAQRAGQTAFEFQSSPDELAAWTYAELDVRACAVAAALSATCAPGDRAVLAFPPGLDFLAAFMGCVYAGVLPAPSTYPRPRRASSRLDGIVADCSPTIGLTTAATLAQMPLDEQAPAVANLRWLAVDEVGAVDSAPAAAFRLAPARLSDPAFLQYTSGSTAEPRGVIVTHGNLLHNLEAIRTGFGLAPAESGVTQAGVFWLPSYHDMGLVGGILTPIYVGGTSRLLPPAAFLQRPLSWLEAISALGAQISGGPNFAYELCVQKSTPAQRAALDLSRWRLAFCGAEPIDPAVLDQFASAFADSGFRRESFYPCYGLAESTLLAAGGTGPAAPRVLRASRSALAAHRLQATVDPADQLPLVSCGAALGGQQLRIVDSETRRPVRSGEVGEIWLAGPSVAAGYWGRPDDAHDLFAATLSGEGGAFLRTGDLGAVVDGQLYVTGRLKDLVIVRGRNLYPQDVERTVQQSDPAIDQGAAFAMAVAGAEELVVVHQIRREHRRDDLEPVLRAIRSAVVTEYDVDPSAIVLLKPGGLPLTSSGKVQRSRCRELFARGELDELAQWRRPASTNGPPSASAFGEANQGGGASPQFLTQLEEHSVATLAPEIATWMLAWLSARAEEGEAPRSAEATFAELGLDSLTAVELHVALEQELGLRLSPTAALTYPTPAALSQYLAESLLGVAPAAGEPAQRVGVGR